MKSCRGCVNYVKEFAVCKARDDSLNTTEVSPYDGVARTHYRFRPKIDEMRAPGAECGPDAVLYRPNLWRRIEAALGWQARD